MNKRYSAFFMHLIISAIVLLSVYWLASTAWYPFYFYQLDGGFEATKVVFLVDIVIGPLLTLVVYKPKKKGLFFDLACIGLMQVLALGYGVYLLNNYRPLAMVLQNGAFYSVTSDVYANYGIEYTGSSSEASRRRCGLDCYIIKDSFEARTSVVVKGVPARVRSEFYVDYAASWEKYVSNKKRLFNLDILDEEPREALKSARYKLASVDDSVSEDGLGFVPIFGRYLSGFFIVEMKNGKIMAFVDDVEPPLVSDR